MAADVLFLEYPKCSTCQKAKKWLDAHDVAYTDRHIVEDNPTAEELRAWHERSGLPLKRFFNTSGMLYREMELSKKLPDMPEDEQYALLATNGMLVKRPLLITAATVRVSQMGNLTPWDTRMIMIPRHRELTTSIKSRIFLSFSCNLLISRIRSVFITTPPFSLQTCSACAKEGSRV